MVEEKYCSGCDETKDADRFGRNRKSRDGLQGWCKDCMREYQREYIQSKNGKLVRWQYAQSDKSKAARKKYTQSERGKVIRRQWSQSDVGKESLRRNQARHVAKHPDRAKARVAVSHAVKMGHLPHISTRDCESCGDQAQEYHHPDYGEQLGVIPLCRDCHVLIDVVLAMQAEEAGYER